MRWGIEGDPGHQGYHGLKGEVPDDFIALGKQRFAATDSAYEEEEAGSVYYLWTSVLSEINGTARILSGEKKPSEIWLNSQIIEFSNIDDTRLQVNSGFNSLLLRYEGPGRTHFVLQMDDNELLSENNFPLSMSWYKKSSMLKFDSLPQNSEPVGRYRFTSPPGFRSMVVTSYGEIQAWADGKLMETELLATSLDGEREYSVRVSNMVPEPVVVAIRVKQERGYYGGAALSEPILLNCVTGKTELGDWSQNDSLASYSGGAWYRRTFELPQEQAQDQVMLNLGAVAATAEIHVNGKLAGIRVAPPWKLDISEYVKPGENRLEILVYNTLANHYMTIPTKYRGSPVSGLIGPVQIEINPVIELSSKMLD